MNIIILFKNKIKYIKTVKLIIIIILVNNGKELR